MRHNRLLSLTKAIWGRGEAGQVQILAVFLFLLLIPTTAIIAQNSTLINLSGGITGDTVSMPTDETNDANGILEEIPNETVSIPTEIVPETPIDNQTNSEQDNETYTDPETENDGYINVSQEPENTTCFENETSPTRGDNVTETGFLKNVSVPGINSSDSNQSTTNQTNFNETPNSGSNTNANQSLFNETLLNETNQTNPDVPVINITPNVTLNDTVQINETGTASPMIDAGIISDDSVTRGNLVEFTAYVKNVGNSSAFDVEIEWVLPDGFTISTGNGSAHCDEIVPGSSCWNNIIVAVPGSSDLGLKDIGIKVRYSG